MTQSQRLRDVLFEWFFLSCLATAVCSNLIISGEQQYSYLARAFLRGYTYFLEQPGTWADSVLWNGEYYWPLSPVPGVLMAPAVLAWGWRNEIFKQGNVQMLMTAGTLAICYWLARKWGYSKLDAKWLAFAFGFAGVYQMVAFISWSWYFVQAIAVFLTFLALFELFSQRRYWVIGVLMGLVFMTRVTAGLGLIFFVLAILGERVSVRLRVVSMAKVLLPTVAGIMILGGYNYVRFGDFFNNGYLWANNFYPETYRYELLNHGLFRVSNIPTNLYYYFLKTLDPVRIEAPAMFGQTHVLRSPYLTVEFPGTSFFVVSPIFLYMFRARVERVVLWAWVTVVVVLMVLLTYYWPGWRQVGPRYLLDLLPFAYLILLASFRRARLPGLTKIVVLASATLNFYLLIRVFF